MKLWQIVIARVIHASCLNCQVKPLSGNKDMGIDANVLDQMSLSIAHLVGLGVQVGIVVGGGNLYRGSPLQKRWFGRSCNRGPNGHAGYSDEWPGPT